MRDCRPRLRAGLDQARAALGQDRKDRRDRGLGSRRHGLRATARARRPRRACIREIRQGRWASPLRHSRLQDGEVSRRSPRGADGYGRRDVPLWHPYRRQRAGRGSAQGLRRGGARGRGGEGTRSADPGPRARGHSFRHGIPAAAEPARQRRAAGHRRADPRRRQARRCHRRRRHRLRLHRHVDPPGRALGPQFRDHAAAAGDREQDADLARLAAEAAHVVEP